MEIISWKMFDIVPEIDYMAGYQYFFKNINNYTQALLSTLKSIKSKLPILESMISSGEYEGLRIIAQTLRKMTANIGAKEIAEATYQLEIVLLNGDDALIQKQLIDFMNNLTEFSTHLEMLLKQLDVKRPSEGSERASTFLNFDFSKTRESIKRSADLIERKII